jgi:hypothetical protein
MRVSERLAYVLLLFHPDAVQNKAENAVVNAGQNG